MLFLLGAAFAISFQAGQATPRQQRPPAVRDSLTDTTSAGRRRFRGIRRPVTAQVLATAFKDATAKKLLLEARAARLRQDSALFAYDAMAYQRISVGLGFSSIGRNRLLFRHESAARIRWQLGNGVWIDAKGMRNAFPMVGHLDDDDAKQEMRDEASDPDMTASIPYYPGYEPLWVGGNMARVQVDERELVHPIADGAEAYYTYESGDSLRFTLPDKRVIQLRELKVRPREPKWNLGVGSLWFDTNTGQLVRAAYRLSVPIDIWQVAKEDDPKSMDDVPKWVTPLITPMRAEVSAIVVEYGLYEGRFWLPRLRMAEGSAQVSFMHVPFKMEESFKYSSVNAKDSIPKITLAANSPRSVPPDTLDDEQRQAWRDSVRMERRIHTRALMDSIHRGLVKENHSSQCDTSDTRVTTMTRYSSQLPVAVRVPCDLSKLESSPDLPASIYDPGEELFGTRDLDALKAQALSLSAQAPLELNLAMLPPPTIAYGPSMMRYNRIEGLSLGASVEQQVGGGYSGTAVGRIGLADHEPNVELTVTRTNLTDAIHVSGYNHLVSASDWGHPLSFSSSFAALMFGRDEGFYYRASGAELGGSRATPFGGVHLDWRAFAEEERSAIPMTSFAVNGADFPANLLARRGTYSGLGAHLSDDFGLDPRGLRVTTDARFEAAAGDSAYGRAALDVTASHGLGALAGSLMLSGGSSVGALPPQRRWYLGGLQTVRGQSPDTAQSGNAYWLTRAELGTNNVGFRPTLFADLGWVGDRSKITTVGRPMSGVGAGVSFLDGLFRLDVARGIYPRQQYRVDLYLESKF